MCSSQCLTALWLVSHQVRVSDDVRYPECPDAASETDVFGTSGLQQHHGGSGVQETRRCTGTTKLVILLLATVAFLTCIFYLSFMSIDKPFK